MEYALQKVVGFGGDGQAAAEVMWVAEVGAEGMVFVVGDGPGEGRSEKVDEYDADRPDIALPR